MTGETRADDVRHPLVELTGARLRLMIREPEMVFWVFVFPLVMALALGVAFRSSDAGAVPVVVAQGAGADAVRSTTILSNQSQVNPIDRPATFVAPSLRARSDITLLSSNRSTLVSCFARSTPTKGSS